MAINKKFGYLLGFIGAISFSEVANSVNLLNTALVSFAVTLSLFAVQKLLNSNKIKFGLLLGFSVGLAINAHLQALSLLTLLPISLIFLKSKRKTRFIVGLSELIGLALSFLPLIVFEIQHNLAWTKSIIDYSLHVGEKFYVPIRWLTDITQFWPEIFGKVIFGVGNLGLIIIMLIIFGLLISFIKKKLPPKIILISLITFVFEIISVRYYKGPRSPEYLIVAQLFIILFFSWSIWQLLSINKIFGFATLLLLSIFILKNDLILLNSKSHSPELISLFNFTKDKYKDINLYLYDDSNEIGYSFLYLLQRNNLTGKSTDLAICDNHESIGLAERCPKENRIQESGRFVLYKFIPESKPSMFGIKELNASKVWNDIHINY